MNNRSQSLSLYSTSDYAVKDARVLPKKGVARDVRFGGLRHITRQGVLSFYLQRGVVYFQCDMGTKQALVPAHNLALRLAGNFWSNERLLSSGLKVNYWVCHSNPVRTWHTKSTKTCMHRFMYRRGWCTVLTMCSVTENAGNEQLHWPATANDTATAVTV